METANAAVLFDAAQNESAIGETYLSVRRSLRNFIARLGARPADVEDIAQEALACAMKAEADRPIENPKAYLFRVAHNLILRQRTVHARSMFEEIDDLAFEEVPAELPSIEDQVISRERLGMLMEAVSALPPVCRRVFVMRKLYGYSHQEIADRLGVSVGTVEKHLTKGLARCFDALREREGDFVGA